MKTATMKWYQFGITELLVITGVVSVLCFVYVGVKPHIESGVFDRLPTNQERMLKDLAERDERRKQDAIIP